MCKKKTEEWRAVLYKPERGRNYERWPFIKMFKSERAPPAPRTPTTSGWREIEPMKGADGKNVDQSNARNQVRIAV